MDFEHQIGIRWPEKTRSAFRMGVHGIDELEGLSRMQGRGCRVHGCMDGRRGRRARWRWRWRGGEDKGTVFVRKEPKRGTRSRMKRQGTRGFWKGSAGPGWSLWCGEESEEECLDRGNRSRDARGAPKESSKRAGTRTWSVLASAKRKQCAGEDGGRGKEGIIVNEWENELPCHAQAEENTHEVRKRRVVSCRVVHGAQPFQVVGPSRLRPGTTGVISPAGGWPDLEELWTEKRKEKRREERREKREARERARARMESVVRTSQVDGRNELPELEVRGPVDCDCDCDCVCD